MKIENLVVGDIMLLKGEVVTVYSLLSPRKIGGEPEVELLKDGKILRDRVAPEDLKDMKATPEFIKEHKLLRENSVYTLPYVSIFPKSMIFRGVTLTKTFTTVRELQHLLLEDGHKTLKL